MRKNRRPVLLGVLLLACVCYAGNDFSTGPNLARISSLVIQETAAAIADSFIELDAFRLDGFFTGVGANALVSTLRVQLVYDISGITNPTKTSHGGAIFAETTLARNNQYFGFGLEDSVKAFVGALASATAAAVSHISHIKIFNDQNIAQVFPAIGWNLRADFFNGDDENDPFSSHVFGYGIRPELFRLGQAYVSTFFGWYSPTDRSIQMVQSGNFIKVAVSTAVLAGATLDFRGACGGRYIMTSTASIVLNGTTFANPVSSVVPSSSTYSGEYNADCEVTLVNGNLNAFTIAIPDTADFIPRSAGTKTLAGAGGNITVWGYPAAPGWVAEGEPR